MKGRRLTITLAAAGVLALVASALCAYVAYGAATVDRELRQSDTAFFVTPARSDLWQVSGAVSWMLRLDGDLELRRASRLYEMAQEDRVRSSGISSRGRRADAQLILARAMRKPLTPGLRARIENLSALLTIQEALDEDDRNRPLLIQRAIEHFRRAIRADRSYEDAKFNLELVLRTLAPTTPTRRSGLDPNAPLGRSAGTRRLGSGFGY